MLASWEKSLDPESLCLTRNQALLHLKLKKQVKDSKKGRVEYRTDKNGVIHSPIGRVSFDIDKLLENYSALVDSSDQSKTFSSKRKIYQRDLSVFYNGAWFKNRCYQACRNGSGSIKLNKKYKKKPETTGAMKGI